MKRAGGLVAALALWAGLAAPADALTREEALLRLGEAIGPSVSNDLLSAWMTPAPLASGVVTEVDGDAPSIDLASLPNPVWFAFVDPDPCALLEHDVSWLLIDDVTGAMTAYAATNLPALDGEAILDPAPGGGRLVMLYSAVPRPDPHPAGSAEPTGDYGDAPDGQTAYPGVTGKFPTFYASANAQVPRPGGHTTLLGEDSLGAAASAEAGPLDPADSDGVTNLVDADSDQRILLAWDPNTQPPTSHILYDVTLAPGAGAGQRYLNVAVDLDNDGRWANAAAATEWVVVNDALPALAVGTTTTLITPAFDWGPAAAPDGPTFCWARLLLTRDETIDPAVFPVVGWDGSGAFGHGEVEDFKVYRHWCPGEGCPRPPGSPPEDPPPPETPPPFVPIGWDLLPVNFFALVIEGVDNPGQSAADEAADGMERVLRTQGYKTTHLDGNVPGGAKAATPANIGKWLLDVKGKVRCQDHILIYFIAHGRKNTPGGSMHLRHAKSGDNGRMSGAELAALLSLIPPCPDENCDVPGKCCDVTVIVESCYSGQFLSALSGEGRNIITSSEGTTPSYFGTDGTGGAYSDAYADCANPANAAVVDGGGGESVDGFVNPTELHSWAAAGLGSPYGKTQIPQINNQICHCECPPWLPDCLCDGYGGVVFFPGLWISAGNSIGVTFDEFTGGYSPPFGIPQYRRVPAELYPDQWVWRAEVPCPGARVASIQVLIFNIPPVAEVRVPLFAYDATSLPPGSGQLPFFLDVDVGGNQFFLQSGSTQFPPIEMSGPLHQFEQQIAEHPLLFPIPAYRTNRVAQPAGPEIELALVDPGDPVTGGPFFDFNWRPKPDSFYVIEQTPDGGSWSDATGPLMNASYTMPRDPGIPGMLFRVRYQSIHDLPPP